MQRIFKVESASLSLLKSQPPQIGMTAQGVVASSGWSNPALGAWVYITPPKDGIQDFDFTASPPAGMSLPVMTPIAASLFSDIDPLNYWGAGKPLKGIRIHAQTNSIVVPFKNDVKTAKTLSDNRPVPWPWSTGELAAQKFSMALASAAPASPFEDLIDRQVYIYRRGQPKPTVFIEGRVLLELDAKGKTIASISFG
jgi:hypothetical protein